MLPLEVLRLATPSISTLNKGTGSRETGLLVFKIAIVSILDFYAAEWSEGQIEDTAEIMHGEYHWLQLAELKHFTIQAKKGTYNFKESHNVKDADGKWLRTEDYDGKIYGKLTPATLLKWAEEYAGQSLATRSDMRIESRGKQNEPVEDAQYVSKERIAEALSELTMQAKEVESARQEEIWKARMEGVREMYGADREALLPTISQVARAIVEADPIKDTPAYLQVQQSHPEQLENYLNVLKSRP